MPWKAIAELLSNSQEASLRGLDPKERSITVELEAALPKRRRAQLTFPCGSSLSGVPVWQRRPGSGEGPVTAAFRLPDLCDETWSEFESQSFKEVREHQRVPIRLWVTFPEEPRPGTVTNDLSPYGCCLRADFQDRVGTEVLFYLDLPDAGAPAKMRAEVIWSDGNTTGLKFLNVRACDEVRILRTLGREATAPSRFLPDLPLTAPAFTFQLERREGRVQLQLSVTNWDLVFEFEDSLVEGPSRGAFRNVDVLESSPALRELRAKLKIDLKESRALSHLRLHNDEGEPVLELVGREVEFWRLPRAPKVNFVEEVLSG